MREDRALKKIERENMARMIFWEIQEYIRNSELDAAKESGRTVGFIEGGMATQKVIARKMIGKGYKIEKIQALTSLPDEEIEELWSLRTK